MVTITFVVPRGGRKRSVPEGRGGRRLSAKFHRALDAAPPLPPPPPAIYGAAAGDLYPRNQREAELCEEAGNPDWLYLAGLVVIDTGATWAGSSAAIKFSDSLPIRMTGPLMIGVSWGATIGGAWMALPKCSTSYIGEPPPEGEVRATWPLALSFALLAAAVTPFVNGIAVGTDLPIGWSTFEREMHVATASVAGFGGALLPYLLPPRTWSAARELARLRVQADRNGAYLGYSGTF